MKTIDLLDEAKGKLGIESDYALAKAINVQKTAVNNYRKGRSRPDEYTCFKLAEILNVEPQAVISVVRADGETDEDKRRFWTQYAKKYGMALSPFVLAGTITLEMTGLSLPANGENPMKSWINDKTILCIMRNRELPKHWKGWTFWENYLVDPDGNRYSPAMVKTSLFTQELAHELMGNPLQVHSLKTELKRRIARLEESPEVVIKWDGHEVSVKLPKRQ